MTTAFRLKSLSLCTTAHTKQPPPPLPTHKPKRSASAPDRVDANSVHQHPFPQVTERTQHALCAAWSYRVRKCEQTSLPPPPPPPRTPLPSVRQLIRWTWLIHEPLDWLCGLFRFPTTNSRTDLAWIIMKKYTHQNTIKTVIRLR